MPARLDPPNLFVALPALGRRPHDLRHPAGHTARGRGSVRLEITPC